MLLQPGKSLKEDCQKIDRGEIPVIVGSDVAAWECLSFSMESNRSEFIQGIEAGEQIPLVRTSLQNMQ